MQDKILDEKMKERILESMINWERRKERIKKFLSSKGFQMFADICRVLLVILLIAIIVILVKEIEAVKLLAYDPCKICMNKTGAICTIPNLP